MTTLRNVLAWGCRGCGEEYLSGRALSQHSQAKANSSSDCAFPYETVTFGGKMQLLVFVLDGGSVALWDRVLGGFALAGEVLNTVESKIFRVEVKENSWSSMDGCRLDASAQATLAHIPTNAQPVIKLSPSSPPALASDGHADLQVDDVESVVGGQGATARLREFLRIITCAAAFEPHGSPHRPAAELIAAALMRQDKSLTWRPTFTTLCDALVNNTYQPFWIRDNADVIRFYQIVSHNASLFLT